MRTASVNHTPAVPYHTLIHGILSTPSTIPFWGNTQYNTNSPPLQRQASATPRHFPPLATSIVLFAATLRPPPTLLARQFLHFSLSSCLFRYPPSSGRRCVQFSSLYIHKLRRAVRSFPSADPASPFARLCDYRLSPIARLATFRRARFMHRIIRRQAHYRFQRKFN